MIIDSFSGPYRFLSNFYPAVVTLDGVKYPTLEHAYQAAKTHNSVDRELIHAAVTPGIAKRLGRRVVCRDEWESVKEEVMLGLLREKFKEGKLAQLLRLTGTTTLIEGNTWGDTYWGVCNGKGRNRLGHLLMRVREEIH